MILSGALQLRASEQPGYYRQMLLEDKQEQDALFAQTGARSPIATQIELDLIRTFPDNRRFSNAPSAGGIDPLRRVLLAYAHRNKELGYCQSMNILAGWLLITLGSEENAFWILCAIAENVCPSYYTQNMIGCQIDMRIFKELLDEMLPALTAKFEREKLSLPLLTSKWFLCIYADLLPSATAVRVWDSFFLHGTLILFRVALSILKLFERKHVNSKISAITSDFQVMPSTIYDHKSLFKVVMSLTSVSHKRINALYVKYNAEVLNETLSINKNKDVQALLSMSLCKLNLKKSTRICTDICCFVYIIIFSLSLSLSLFLSFFLFFSFLSHTRRAHAYVG